MLPDTGKQHVMPAVTNVGESAKDRMVSCDISGPPEKSRCGCSKDRAFLGTAKTLSA